MSTLKSHPTAAGSNHQSWVSILELAAREVFETMLNSQLTLAVGPSGEADLDITAMVGLAGLLCGVLTIRCSSKTGLKIASKMLGVEAERAGPQVWDALGEVSNMIAGNFKNKITGLGDGCMLSVPTVITGADYNCHSMGNSETLRVEFLLEKNLIVASLEIHS